MAEYFFTAPRAGIYEFIFKSHKTGGCSELYIALRLKLSMVSQWLTPERTMFMPIPLTLLFPFILY